MGKGVQSMSEVNAVTEWAETAKAEPVCGRLS